MFEKLELTRMAQGLAAHAGTRMGVIAENIANADTPGYKVKDLADFASVYRAKDNTMRATRPGHIGTDGGDPPLLTRALGTQAPNGNSVSLEQEMVKTAAVRQDHDMALSIYRATSDVIRASLGRK